MKLKINKACDLSSISVLPPHSRRLNPLGSASEVSGLGKGPAAAAAAQLRSQSQQSFSQGVSLSQLSQSSFDENLTNDQRFDSQERDKSKRLSSLAPIMATRNESQMQLTRNESQIQLSRTSDNVMRRWSSASDNKCQVSEELEHRFRLMETSLTKLGMILDSVQSDVMQVNRAVKEATLETEGVRQKIILLDNSMQLMVKEEEEIKALVDRSLKSLLDQMMKGTDHTKLNDIASSLLALPKQIEACLLKLQQEICVIITQKMEGIANDMKSFGNNRADHIQSMRSSMSPSFISCRQYQKSQIPATKVPILSPSVHTKSGHLPKLDAEIQKALRPKLTASSQRMTPKEIPLSAQEKDFRVIIESDEEGDVGLSCLLVKKETGKSSYLVEEAREETLRILRRARKRKRRQNKCVILD